MEGWGTGGGGGGGGGICGGLGASPKARDLRVRGLRVYWGCGGREVRVYCVYASAREGAVAGGGTARVVSGAATCGVTAADPPCDRARSPCKCRARFRESRASL
jgi:hypothetical protein